MKKVTATRGHVRSSMRRVQTTIFALALMLLLQLQLARLGSAKYTPVYVDDRAQNYLMKFGYLPQSGLETGNLRTDDQLRDAIRSLQRFGGVPETGQLDDATQKLMQSRRCGLADKPDPRMQDSSQLRRYKRYTLHGTPWKHLNLTWSLRTDRPSGLETGGVRRELSRALDVWAKNSKLTFQEINSDSADILISFHRGYHGDGYPFDGRGQILAHAFFPGNDRGGDAHFDEEEEWTLGSSSTDDGTSLFAVAAHEFGHSLGLAHSSVRGALMYPWYQGITEDYELPEDDKHGIQQMYGAPDRLWGNNPDYKNYRPRPPRPSTTTTTTTTTTTSTTTTSTSTTRRPWRTRPRPSEPTPPSKDDGGGGGGNDDRPYRPNHYPEDRPRHRHPHHSTTEYAPRYYPSWITTSTTTSSPPTRHRPTPHRPNYYPSPSTPHHRHRPTPRKDLPDKCDTSYDAISLIRRELFIFKGKYVWRLNDNGLVDGFPAEINQLFKFPMEVEHVDAVYERPDNNRIVFFIGRWYYVFNAFYLEPGYPKPLTHLGLPAELDRIDAAVVWGYNQRTYFFSSDMYWRFDDSVNHVELDYPRDISMFAGIGRHVDAVLQWKNGTTYFFEGKHFWQFDDRRMRVAHKKPRSSAHYWMGCPRGVDTNDVDLEQPIKPSAAPKVTSSLMLMLIAATIIRAWTLNLC